MNRKWSQAEIKVIIISRRSDDQIQKALTERPKKRSGFYVEISKNNGLFAIKDATFTTIIIVEKGLQKEAFEIFELFFLQKLDLLKLFLL